MVDEGQADGDTVCTYQHRTPSTQITALAHMYTSQMNVGTRSDTDQRNKMKTNMICRSRDAMEATS